RSRSEGPEPRIETRRRRPSTSTKRPSAIGPLVDVPAGGGRELRMSGASEVPTSRPAGAPPPGRPPRPLFPPGSRARPGGPPAPPPLLWIGVQLLRPDEVLGLRVARRVDDRLDVAARAEDERPLAAEEARRAVDRLPGRDVVGHCPDRVDVAAHPGEVDRRAE